MMLLIDEADSIAPQRPLKTEGGLEPRLLGAAEDIVRRGGQRGIGVTLISQRAAVLNKNVLTQCGVLIAMRTVASQDLDAIDAWIHEADESRDRREQCLSSLPYLRTGEGWVWSTAFPPPDGLFVRANFLLPQTFDSSATPRVGQARVVPKNAADVDIEAFRRELAETIERAKAHDPRELQRQIHELKAQLKKQQPSHAARELEILRAQEKEWEQIVSRMDSENRSLRNQMEDMRRLLSSIGKLATGFDGAGKSEEVTAGDRVHVRPHAAIEFVSSRSRRAAPPRAASASAPGPLQRRILTVLAHYPRGKSRRQLGVHTAKAHKGGYFGNVLGTMKTSGWIDGTPELYTITDAGRAALGSIPDLPKGQSLLEHWKQQLNTTEYGIVETLYNAHPRTMSRWEVGAVLDKEAGGGYFGNCMSRVRALELVAGSNDALSVSEVFFED
jgi:hypothetical protein